MIMKRILLSFMAVLLLTSISVIANAQVMPDPANEADYATHFKGAKHMWVCADQVQPVSLEWDVAGKGLSLSNGKWEAIFPSATISGYNNKNVFNVLEVTEGTYIFKYKVDPGKDFCSLTAGQYVWVYVHVLPNMVDISSTPIAVCKGEALTAALGFNTDPISYINPAIIKAIQDGGYVITANPATIAATDFNTSTTGLKTKDVNFTITPSSTAPTNFSAPAYACGDAFKLTVTVNVGDLINIDGIKNAAPVCLDDINPLITNGDFYGLFNTMAISKTGTWSAPTGQPTPPTSGLGMVIDYSAITAAGTYTWTFSYTDCNGAAKVVTYNLTVTSGGTPALTDKDLTICKDNPSGSSNVNLTTLYGTTKTLRWTYKGIDGNGAAGPTNPIVINDHFINPNLLSDNFTYYFEITEDVSSGTCTAGTSATVRVKASSINNASSSDERIAICRGTNEELDFAAMFGKTGATWSPIAPTAVTIGAATGKIAAADVAALNVSTYQFQYNFGLTSASNLCAASGDGIVFLTVRNNPVVSNNITITFCTQTMGTVNLYNLLGVYTKGTWTSAPSATIDAAGNVDLVNLYAGPSTPDYVFTFTPDPSSCLTGAYTVTVKFTNDITTP